MAKPGRMHPVLWAVLMAIPLSAAGFTLFMMLAHPEGFRSSGSQLLDLDTRSAAILFIVLFGGGFALVFAWGRRHRRRMEELGLDPDADAERYAEVYWSRVFPKDGATPDRAATLGQLRELTGIGAVDPLTKEDFGLPRDPAPNPGGDQPLAHYVGAWRALPEERPAAGWIAGAEFRAEGTTVYVRTYSVAASGLADDGEFRARLVGGEERVQFIELAGPVRGRQRRVRFTESSTGAIYVHEIQHPPGNPRAMSAKSGVLRRV